LPAAPALGLAPAREEIFDTISEFRAARGIFGGGFEATGGICEGFGVEMGFSVVGGTVVMGDGVFGDAEEVFVGGADEAGEMVIGDGLEGFGLSGDAGTLFADSSRTCFNILEVSGVTGGFGGGLEGTSVLDFDSAFGGEVGAEGCGAGFVVGEAVPAGFDIVGAIGAFDVAIGVVFTGFGIAFVDFARAVDFFFSGISISMGSEMTFLGLPFFLTTSADMLCIELVPQSCWRRC
jgi:hypothetical protein